MAKIVPLFSGSKGNSYYIGTQREGVLIDAGRSCRQIETAMELNGLSMKSVAAVFVTHEHSDHCSALKVLASRYGLDVYASAGTLRELERADRIADNVRTYVIEQQIAIGNMLVERFNTPHDAAESCCYRVNTSDGKTALVATDMGFVNDDIHAAAGVSDLVVLESNHDIEMLKNGIYPYYLKQRILSDRGHLSNDLCARELESLVRGGTLRLMLGHLSENNNTPQLALSTSVAALDRAGMKHNIDYTLDLAPPRVSQKAVVF